MKKKKQNRTSPDKRLFFYIVPYTLLIILATLLIYKQKIQHDIRQLSIRQGVSTVDISDYPTLNLPFDPYLSAGAAIIMDDASKRILYSKNLWLRFSTASTAKIMSALVALEHFRFEDILTVPDDVFEGTVVGFTAKERLYFDDVLYAMMLASGNDAAYTIATNYPGGIEKFVERMNAKANEMHLQNTHFTDPAGLDDDGNYTTVLDLARLSAAALEDDTLERVVSTKWKIFTNVDGTKTYEITNLNRLLGSYGVVGIKTGQTIGAGGVLSTAIVENGKRLIIVVMKSTDRFGDTLSLINLLHNNLTYYSAESLLGLVEQTKSDRLPIHRQKTDHPAP